ncbi:hypothetical protein mRhiFer1_009233 [Rhinolophus ferrumequinum]|uniref:Uncharacterized protein n=1 Tax=Rhinolophus ferrumequinum TaxID=59479 RepID=A0A7J7S7N7_RHIFE|nr:hypothetical protein mRhiFer1_009233 [Rhinolophus ferrumequinum]
MELEGAGVQLAQGADPPGLSWHSCKELHQSTNKSLDTGGAHFLGTCPWSRQGVLSDLCNHRSEHWIGKQSADAWSTSGVKLHLGTTWALKQLEKGQMNKLFLLLLKWKHINLTYTKEPWPSICSLPEFYPS